MKTTKADVSAWVITLAWTTEDSKIRSRTMFLTATDLTAAFLKAATEVKDGPEVVVGVVMSSFAK